MTKKRNSPKGIIHKLRRKGVPIAERKTIAEVCKQHGVTDQTYCRWREEY